MLFRRMLPVGSLTLTLILALSASVLADDVILIPGATYKAAGGRVRGEVQSESPTEVKVKLGAKTESVPTDQIAEISYAGQPASMALAESKESAGALAEAADLYKKAAGEAGGKPFVQQAALFGQAKAVGDLALADPNKASEAINLLEAFVKAYPTGRHIASALEVLARIQLQKGDFAQAEKTIAELAKQPASGDRAAVLRAKVFAKRGDHAKAITELDGLIKGAPDGSVRQREARLAKAESLVGLKKYAEAEADVRAVIKSTPPEDIQAQAAAYNTLGDCLRAAGKPKDALYAYLYTDIVYYKDKEQHPRALAQISQLWRELKRDDRADEYLDKLKQEYPQSPYLTSRSGR